MKNVLWVILVIGFLGCSKKEPEVVMVSAPQDLVARGKRVYLSNCTSCHNPNPKLDGSLAPSIFWRRKRSIKKRGLTGDIYIQLGMFRKEKPIL